MKSLIQTLELSDIDDLSPLMMLTSFATLISTYTTGKFYFLYNFIIIIYIDSY